MRTVVIVEPSGKKIEYLMNRVDNAIPFINQRIERGLEMDTDFEIRMDKWIEDHKYECGTCKFEHGDHQECLDCEGQNWREKNWAQELKKQRQQMWKKLKGEQE